MFLSMTRPHVNIIYSLIKPSDWMLWSWKLLHHTTSFIWSLLFRVRFRSCRKRSLFPHQAGILILTLLEQGACALNGHCFFLQQTAPASSVIMTCLMLISCPFSKKALCWVHLAAIRKNKSGLISNYMKFNSVKTDEKIINCFYAFTWKSF